MFASSFYSVSVLAQTSNPITDFFNWLRTLFGIQYTALQTTGGLCTQNSDCLSNYCSGIPNTITLTTNQLMSSSGYYGTVMCPSTAYQCKITVNNCPNNYLPSYSATSNAPWTVFTNPLAVSGSSTTYVTCSANNGLSTSVGSAVYSATANLYGTCTGYVAPVCGNGVKESGEICEIGTTNVQTIASTQNNCQGTIQQTQSCLSDCSGYTSWSDVPNSFVKSDKCCGITCQQQTATCNSYCSGSNYCSYSSLTATCTPSCSNGICGSCTASCGTPSCTQTKGHCGVTCSLNSDCQSVTKTCDNYCDSSGQWCVYLQPSKVCNPSCSSGQCTGCDSSVLNSICGTPTCSFVSGKCSATCTPGTTQSCGNCGIRTCTSSAQWGDCVSQQNLCGSGYICQ